MPALAIQKYFRLKKAYTCKFRGSPHGSLEVVLSVHILDHAIRSLNRGSICVDRPRDGDNALSPFVPDFQRFDHSVGMSSHLFSIPQVFLCRDTPLNINFRSVPLDHTSQKTASDISHSETCLLSNFCSLQDLMAFSLLLPYTDASLCTSHLLSAQDKDLCKPTMPLVKYDSSDKVS